MAGNGDDFACFGLVILVVGVILVEISDVAGVEIRGGLPAADAGDVLFQGRAESGGGGEQALLEQLEDEFGGHAFAIGRRVLEPQRGIRLQIAMGLPFFLGVSDFQVPDHALGEAAATIPAQLQFRLHAPHHHRFQLGAIRGHGTGEALVIQEFQQGGEAFPIAIVRRRG